jgi:hypothetical protein
MTPNCFLMFWCLIEIVSYAFSLLLIAALFWPNIRSRGEDQQARAAVEEVGGADWPPQESDDPDGEI